MTAPKKDLLLAKMQELDVAVQTVVRVRSEIYSIIAAMPSREELHEVGIPLVFYENGHIIAWGDDSEHFTPSTFRLLRQLWCAPDHFVSKEDIRQDVQEDEYSTPEALRTLIKAARKELKVVDFPYEIETRWNKGYRIIACSQT
jgi:DNA-binding response OmpR family regulator